MTPKTPVTTTKPPVRAQKSAEAGAAEFAARWIEARLAYPLYAALAAQFNLAPLPYSMGELPPQRPTREVFDRDLQWLDAIDSKVRAYQIRQLPSEILNSSEEALRSFIQRQLKKPDKTTVDRDKIDLLLVQYFALCAPVELYREAIKLEDVARVLQPVLTEADSTSLEWCQPLEKILETLDHCHSLRDLMEHGLLEQGRLVKESAGAMFYDPAALVAFCRFNFSLRRAFIRMLHADWTAVQQAVEALDASGVKSVDCRRAGFSAAETTAQLRTWCENWRQPFHKDYTESSVSHAFEQLLALRADLEEALGHPRPEPFFSPSSPKAARPDAPVSGSDKTPVAHVVPPPAAVQVSPPIPKKSETKAASGAPVAQAPTASPAANKPARSAADGPAKPTAAADAEKCLEAIWEQLIAAPPSRGRSMSTVVLQDTKVLLSSWEVAAFVAEGGQEAEDLRRAVVARALLAVAGDQRKRSGDDSALASALVHARSEVSYFQGRVEQAKRAKNTEAAVNLGISTKRLLSFIEESEKLQP
ncbi:MAG TPA: hypothetical protein VEX69_01050 [Candidatus Limnocylindria bacterium]|nr:hypothetical protein [Candidatus Limnocylindria bacterium]